MSIQPNELRLGNWLSYKGDYYQVEILESNMVIDEFEGIEPIPLSPEILERCGFEKDDDDYLLKIDDRSCLHINFNKERYLIESYDGLIKIKNINYLHQLQNLYHSLVGQELQFNPNRNNN